MDSLCSTQTTVDVRQDKVDCMPQVYCAVRMLMTCRPPARSSAVLRDASHG